MYSYKERLSQAEDSIEMFVDLSDREKIDMLTNFVLKVQKNPNPSKAEAMVIEEKGERFHTWTLRWCQMEKAGWNMDRRDALFFANIQRPITTFTDEIKRQILGLQKEYIKPAKKARKQGQYGKAARLEKLYERQSCWIDHVLNQG